MRVKNATEKQPQLHINSANCPGEYTHGEDQE